MRLFKDDQTEVTSFIEKGLTKTFKNKQEAENYAKVKRSYVYSIYEKLKEETKTGTSYFLSFYLYGVPH